MKYSDILVIINVVTFIDEIYNNPVMAIMCHWYQLSQCI